MQRQELIMTPISPQGKVLGNLIGSAIALEIAAQKTNFPHPLVVLCSDSIEARRLSQELRYLCPQEQILDFLEYETLPYDILSPHQDIISSRLEFLSQVPSLNSGLIVTSVAAFMQRLSLVSTSAKTLLSSKLVTRRTSKTYAPPLLRMVTYK